MPRVAGLVALLLVLAITGTRAVNSTYSVEPVVTIRPIFPNSKLILTASNLTVDPDTNRFYLTVDCTYSGQAGVGVLPRATLVGRIAWQQPGLVMFSFPDDTAASCQQPLSSSPPLCPYIQELVNGPFYFAAGPSTGPTVVLMLEASTTYIDPMTNKPLNFLGASIALAYGCEGVCEEFEAQVPPARLPENATFTVRFFRRSPPENTSKIDRAVVVFDHEYTCCDDIYGVERHCLDQRLGLRARIQHSRHCQSNQRHQHSYAAKHTRCTSRDENRAPDRGFCSRFHGSQILRLCGLPGASIKHF